MSWKLNELSLFSSAIDDDKCKLLLRKLQQFSDVLTSINDFAEKIFAS